MNCRVREYKRFLAINFPQANLENSFPTFDAGIEGLE